MLSVRAKNKLLGQLGHSSFKQLFRLQGPYVLYHYITHSGICVTTRPIDPLALYIDKLHDRESN